MRLIKMFGLAAIAAVAAMALVGASSAMAGSTTLCKTAELPCAAGNQKSHIEAVATKPTLLSSVVVHCETSTALGTVSGATLANPLLIKLEKLTWVNCLTSGGNPCTVSNVKLGHFLVLKVAVNTATVQSHGTEVNVNCSGFINCTYGGLPTLHGLGLEPGSRAKLVANKLVLTKTGGFFCPATAEWDAEYISTPELDLHISS